MRAVQHTRGNRSQRVGNQIINARLKNGLMVCDYQTNKKFEKLEEKICRIPRLFTIEIISLTIDKIEFIAICSDEYYLEASKKHYVYNIK